jgi:imidazolonepropionase-like amidohydrolase
VLCVAPGQEGALADILLVNGNPLDDLTLFLDPGKKFALIMKNGITYKKIVE